MAMVRFLLLESVVPSAYLILVIEPCLVVFGLSCIEYPLAEALADGLGISLVDFAGLRVFIIGAQMRVQENDAPPDLEQVGDLILQDIIGEAKIDNVLVREEGRKLQLFPLLHGDWRTGDFG